jgi:hypothetical protein
LPLNDSGQHLGDLPNAGYASKREKSASDWMQDIIRKFEREPPEGVGRDVLLLVVCGGLQQWREIARKEMRGALKGPALDEACDAVFYYLCKLAGHNPQGQLEQLRLMRQWAPWQLAHGYHLR